jgi:hypothetical protein
MKTVLKLFGYLSAASLGAAIPAGLVGFTDLQFPHLDGPQFGHPFNRRMTCP